MNATKDLKEVAQTVKKELSDAADQAALGISLSVAL